MSSDQEPRELIASAEQRLRALCKASGYGAREDEVVALWRIGLGGRPRLPGSLPLWPSDVTDDHTPFEFSLAFMPSRTDLRVLTEPIVDPPSMVGQLEASQDVTRALVRHLAIDETRLRRVADLFAAPHPQGSFVRWHAIEFSGSDRPRVKVYLNPAARGPTATRDALETALVRLGRRPAWDIVASHLVRGEDDELKYFSLDLAPDPEARIKVYVRHHGATEAEIEAFVAGARGFSSGRVAAFCRETLGASPFTARPVFTCLAWNDAGRLPIATVYTPIAAYATDDAQVYDRVVAVLRTAGVDSRAYERAIAAFAQRKLCDGVGMHSYVSMKVDASDPRIGVYLSPECYEIRAPRGAREQAT